MVRKARKLHKGGRKKAYLRFQDNELRAIPEAQLPGVENCEKFKSIQSLLRNLTFLML